MAESMALPVLENGGFGGAGLSAGFIGGLVICGSCTKPWCKGLFLSFSMGYNGGKQGGRMDALFKMDILFLMLWIFDIAVLLCMVCVYFSRHHCSRMSLVFINVIPPVSLVLAAGIGAVFPYLIAVLAAVVLSCLFFHAGNRLLIMKGRHPVPIFPSGLIVLLSLPVWAAAVGFVGFCVLVQLGYAQ